MIQSFADRRTSNVFHRERNRRLDRNLENAAYRKLMILHSAKTLQDVNIPPNNRLEALKGERRGHYSIRVNRQWRICFRWEDGSAHDVELIDYH